MVANEIIVACISGLVTLSVCMINNRSQRKRVEDWNSETISLIDYRLDELTKQVEKHNKVIDRTYKLEETVRVDEEKIKVANHRIEDLERKLE